MIESQPFQNRGIRPENRATQGRTPERPAWGARRCALRRLGVVLLCVWIGFWSPSAARCAEPPPDSLAHLTPSDVGLFVEVRGMEDLLESLTEPSLWLTLAELAGQPARPDEVTQWRRTIETGIDMQPGEAIRRLFARGAAFVGEGVGGRRDGALLCRPRESESIRQLLTQWEARRLPLTHKHSVYELKNGVSMAVLDDVLLFGDSGPGAVVLPRVLALVENGEAHTLAANPSYRELLSRVPDRPDAVLFARLAEKVLRPATSAPTTRPVGGVAAVASRGELPQILRGAAHVLMAVHREGARLHFTAVGDGSVAASQPDSPSPKAAILMLNDLPARTLLGWAGIVDYAGLLESGRGLPERSALRLGLGVLEKSEPLSHLLLSLRGETSIAVGLVDAPSRAVGAPAAPAAALLIRTEDAELARAAIDEVLRSAASVYNLFALRWGTRPLPPIEEAALEGVSEPVHLIDLRMLLEPWDDGVIRELELCWVIDRDVLIVATHRDWIRQILEARRGRGPTLRKVLEISNRSPSENSPFVVVLQLGPLADLGAAWLRWFDTYRPMVTRDDWWKHRQPGGASVRLGVNGTEDVERQRLLVASVDPNGPAAGQLRANDVIVGCGGRRFATSQPVREIQDCIANRADPRIVMLTVERDGKILPLTIRVPFVNPIDLLRRVVAIGRIAQYAVYHESNEGSKGAIGRLTVELRLSQTPLFEIPIQDGPRPVGIEDGKEP